MKKLLLAMGLVAVVFILPQSKKPGTWYDFKSSARKLLERSLKPGTGLVSSCEKNNGSKDHVSSEYWQRFLEEVIDENGV